MIPSSSSFFDTFEILVRFNYRDQITCLGLGSRFCLSVGAVKKTSQTIFVRKSLWQISLKFVYAGWRRAFCYFLFLVSTRLYLSNIRFPGSFLQIVQQPENVRVQRSLFFVNERIISSLCTSG